MNADRPLRVVTATLLAASLARSAQARDRNHVEKIPVRFLATRTAVRVSLWGDQYPRSWPGQHSCLTRPPSSSS